ncbi:histidine kinase [Salinivibrio sp. MA351]|uniref:PAS domain-containing protein n=1 Tax=unclassified Salinivibrio TaxID=2636825 RepID=UPI00098919DF|nr:MULTISPECIES: PAS domain-containing protein [unclassified Salinivibrio]OOE99290.1 histidine kinase [Salinivibrio sp. MA351]OOF04009.1 histidine kinase [Salinivibrio sp. MA440]
MRTPSIPDNEAERQQALDETELLNSGADPRFERITRLCLDLFSVPIALVSLIDRERQYFKSRQGVDASETPRDISFCGHAILGSEPLIVENALDDMRFCDNPLVCGAPDIRFYAGMPIHSSEGYRLGTLCLIDNQPRQFSEENVAQLKNLAGMVEDLIWTDTYQRRESTALQQQLQASHNEMTSLVNNIPGITFRCLPDKSWTMLYISNQVDTISGYTAEDLINNKRVCYADLIHPDDVFVVDNAVANAMANNEEWHIEYRVRHRTLGFRWVEERGKCIDTDPRHPLVLEGFIIDITRERNALTQLERHHQALTVLTDIAFSSHGSLDEIINHALQEAKLYLRAELAIVSEIKGEVYTVNWIAGPPDTTIVAGQQFALKDTWCQFLMAENPSSTTQEQFIADTDRPEFQQHPCYKTAPLGSYAGVVINIYDRPWGTLNVSSAKARSEDYNDGEKLFLRLLGNWLSDVLTQNLSQQRLTKLAALLPGTLYQFRRFPDGRMVFPYSSPQIETLYGITPEQAAEDAIPAFERIHPGDIETVSRSIEHSANTLEHWQSTYQINCPGKGYRWISGEARPEKMIDGSILWHGYLQDVHEQHQARLALEQSEARLRSLFDFSPIGIALNDFATGQFLDLNDALTAPTGYTREEFVSLSYWDVTPKEYEPEEQKALASMQSTGRYGPFEKEYIRKDGSRYPVRLQGMLSTELDGRKVIWSLVEDITERKKLDKMKDEFIATVSHELRTPLTSIKGALGLLNGGATGELPPKANKLLHTAERNATRLTLLINDLLDMEKLVAGKMPIQKQKQDLGSLLDDAIESVKSYQHQTQTQIRPPNNWPAVTVNVDGPRLIQALTNLLSNAIKFSPEGEWVDVSVIVDKTLVEIAIRDRGPGVDLAFQDRLFQRFSQADSSDNRKVAGTGLGLAITREICQQMDGNVGYRDAEGGGALFFIQLQVAQ